MAIKILMPALSPTMKEGNFARWLKKEGDFIKAGEIIAEIETDKATMEIECVDEGRIGKIIVQDGTKNVKVNSLIAIVLEEGDGEAEIQKILDNSDINVQQSDIQNTQNKIDTNKINNKEIKNNENKRIFISPLAKKIAEQNNVNISKINGTGSYSRIIKDDIINFIQNNQVKETTSINEIQSIQQISTMRRVIAERLTYSKQNIPHFYISAEIDASNISNIRKSINENSQTKVSINDIIVKCISKSIFDYPAINRIWQDENIIKFNSVDISIAVSIEGGLITPVLKNSEVKTLSEISSEIKNLIQKAKDGKLRLEEITGGAITISNLGMYGTENFQAIINPPQSSIIAVSAIKQKPIVKNDQIISCNMLNINLSCDHRVIDGTIAAEFINIVKKYMENPILAII